MKLIITEKPSVALEYKKILHVNSQTHTNGYFEGNNYCITWCIGHLITMSYPDKYDDKYKKWCLEDLPFLPDEYKYEIIENVKKQYLVVSKLLNSKKIDTIYYAGDSGREGLYIQWLVRTYSGHNPAAVEKCVWIDSQTAEAIINGIQTAKPMDSYRLLADAAYMRGIEDYAIGINFSRILTLKYADCLNQHLNEKKYIPVNVGRVMTCVLGMVVRKEREIRNFKEIPFYRITADLCTGPHSTEFMWKAVEGSKYHCSPLLYKDIGFLTEKDAAAVKTELSSSKSATIIESSTKLEKSAPPMLFNLAELQNKCSSLLKITPAQTLDAAQELYEAKLTTYPRTDARVLSSAVAKEIDKTLKGLMKFNESRNAAQTILDNEWHKKILSSKYVNDKKITDHYAIIPTGKGFENYESLKQNTKKIYTIILRRFLSIFYPAALYQVTKATAKIQTECFFYSDKVLKECGYLSVLEPDKEKEPGHINPIPDIKEGDILPINEIRIDEGKTTAPKKYTTGSLIIAMENAGQLIEDEELREQINTCGIGTSATRSDIIKKLESLHYIKINKKTQVVSADKAGEMVHDIVFYTLRPLLSAELTANWEKGLSLIEHGKISRLQYQEKLYAFIKRQAEGCKKTTRDSIIRARLEEIDKIYK